MVQKRWRPKIEGPRNHNFTGQTKKREWVNTTSGARQMDESGTKTGCPRAPTVPRKKFGVLRHASTLWVWGGLEFQTPPAQPVKSPPCMKSLPQTCHTGPWSGGLPCLPPSPGLALTLLGGIPALHAPCAHLRGVLSGQQAPDNPTPTPKRGSQVVPTWYPHISRVLNPLFALACLVSTVFKDPRDLHKDDCWRLLEARGLMVTSGGCPERRSTCINTLGCAGPRPHGTG